MMLEHIMLGMTFNPKLWQSTVHTLLFDLHSINTHRLYNHTFTTVLGKVSMNPDTRGGWARVIIIASLAILHIAA